MNKKFIFPIVLLLAIAIHPALALALLFTGGIGVSGTSYNIANVQTATGIVSAAANDREQAWAKKIILGAFNMNVFADNMIGAPGSGKAFIDITDVQRVAGNSVTITSVPQLGGEGAQGETQRYGTEEKIGGFDQNLTLGRQFYGMGVTTVAQAETIIGSQWDQLNSPLLEQRVGLKKSNDMQMVLREQSTSDNRVFPNGKVAVSALKTADTFQTSVITKANNVLSSNGATPMVITKDPKRGMVEGYTFVGAHTAFTSLYNDTTYTSAVEQGAVRGDTNPLFTGKYSDWLGNMIYPFQIRARGGRGSVGSPLLRQAFLGIALPTNGADDTQLSGVITGGGSNYANANAYFEHFSGYAYKLTNGLSPTNNLAQAGSTLTGDGTGPWYVAIIDKTTGKYALCSYTGNTGATLTGVKRLGASASNNILTTLTSSSMTYSTSAYNASSNPITTAAGGGAQGLSVGAIAQGSLIVEVNALGVPFADTLGLGEQAGVCCFGKVPGSDSVFGKRQTEVKDIGKDVIVGFEFSFGCRALLNPDGVATNFVRITHALSVDGLPTVS